MTIVEIPNYARNSTMADKKKPKEQELLKASEEVVYMWMHGDQSQMLSAIRNLAVAVVQAGGQLPPPSSHSPAARADR
jgi:hypothetical protein